MFRRLDRHQLPSLTAENKMSNGKMKGLLKGLRYISQIFDGEKETEMEIGYPTDVKHVAHIGWEGPSVNSPAWMNQFNSTPAISSSSLAVRDSVKEGSSKSSRRDTSLGGAVDSPTREKPEKPKSRRSSRAKDSLSNNGSKVARKPVDPIQGCDSPTLKLPSTPKKSRRKKAKDSSVGGSTRSRSRAQPLETC